MRQRGDVRGRGTGRCRKRLVTSDAVGHAARLRGPAAPPATWSGPITITQGGTYSGSWESTSASTPAVRVATSAPVTITGRVRNLAGGGLIDSPFGTGARVTIDHVSLYGGNGRGIEVENFNSLEVTNCTFDKTSGTYALNPLPGARVYIARNKVRNIQAGAGGKLAHAFQFNRVQGASSFVVEWNEVINTYGQSAEEDGISLYRSAGSTVRNNYLQGGYPASSSMSYTGTGILTDDIGSSSNTFHDNHVVGWTNVGIGITAGSGSVIRNNRVISDGRLDNGVTGVGRATHGHRHLESLQRSRLRKQPRVRQRGRVDGSQPAHTRRLVGSRRGEQRRRREHAAPRSDRQHDRGPGVQPVAREGRRKRHSARRVKPLIDGRHAPPNGVMIAPELALGRLDDSRSWGGRRAS